MILSCRHPVPDWQRDGISMGDGTHATCCSDCWNASRVLAKAERQAELEAQREKGREYWRQRGISVGDRVFMLGAGLFGTFRVFGVAKVGAAGAYVICNQPSTRGRQLDPRSWHKITA